MGGLLRSLVTIRVEPSYKINYTKKRQQLEKVRLSSGSLPQQMIHAFKPPPPTEVSAVHFEPEPPSLLLLFLLIRIVGMKLLRVKILRCKFKSIFRGKTKTYAAIYIYALRIRLTPKLSRIAPQIPEPRSCQQVVAFLTLRQKAWTFEEREP